MKNVLDNRLHALRQAMVLRDLGGVVINQRAYIFHLTNWLPNSWVTAFLVIGPSDLILISPLYPEDMTLNRDIEIEFETYSTTDDFSGVNHAIAVLKRTIKHAKLEGGRVGAVLGAFPAVIAFSLAGLVDLHDATDLFFAATAVKDEFAQQAIRERVAMLDRGFETAAEVIRSGTSEVDVYAAIHDSITHALGGPFTLDCTLSSGPRTLINEPQPTNKLLNPGEIVQIDVFPNLGGYVADYARNYVVGPPSDAQQAQHTALEKALATAEAALCPGIIVSEIDRICRHVIEEEGFSSYCYKHHTGHGFGLLAGEPPWITPGDSTPLQAGMVIAIEPGIYHPQNGGMRLEGNYIITEDGYESLTGYPAVLTPCGI